MSDRRSNPPKCAIRFLQNVCPGDNEALTGDLIERFREGQTRAWFWKQVLIAFSLAGCGKANFAERSPSPEMNQARISQWVLMVKRFEAIVAG